jgi:ATP-dependent helicase/nuclease subunit A
MLQLPTDQAHRDLAIDPSRSVLVRAPAGSGKTGVLLLRYLNCLLTVDSPEQVVAITFTNKAAGEIKERVTQALAAGKNPNPATPFDAAISSAVEKVLKHDSERGWQITKNTSRLRISTFDSFCGSLAKRLPLMSGMGSARPITDSRTLYREAIIDLFHEIDNPDCPVELKSALERLLAYGSNRIETLIPLMAGLMGKRDQWVTDVMAGDIDSMEQTLSEIVSRKFNEVDTALSQANFNVVIAAVVESSATCEHHAFASDLDPNQPLSIFDLPVLSKLASMFINSDGNLYSPRSVRFTKFENKQPGSQEVKTWLQDQVDQGTVEDVSYALATLAALPAMELPESTRALVTDFFIALKYLLAYQRLVFDRHGGVDFTEIAQRAIYALSQEDQITDAVLQEDRIAHILIDEMQDTSVSQIQLLTNLCQDWEPDDGRSIFFCGDVQQSIYAFRGSLVTLFDQLSQSGHFANRPLEQLQLTSNFRSSPDLVNWVNTSFTTLFTQKGKAYTPAVPQKIDEGSVIVHPYIQAYGVKARRQIAELEARNIVEEIQRIQRDDQDAGTETSIAILARARTHLPKIVEYLKEANIEFSGQDIDKLAQTAPVLDLTALLRALWHDADDVAWARLLRTPFVGLSWEDLRILREDKMSLRQAVNNPPRQLLSASGLEAINSLVNTMTWIDSQPECGDIRWIVKTAWYKLGGPACVNAEQQKDIDRVFVLLEEHAPSGIIEDISAFERALEDLYATPPATSIEIMTVHKSKGLEFDVVFLPGLGQQSSKDDSPLLVWQHANDHLLIAPKPQEFDPEAARYYTYLDQQRRDSLKDEYDRQLYVALTRAKKHLHLYGFASMTKTGDISASSTSYLGRLWPIVSGEFDDAMVINQSDDANESYDVVGSQISKLEIQLTPVYETKMIKVSPLQNVQRQTENAVIEDNIEQRATGIVFHEIMERLGRSGVDSLPLHDNDSLSMRVLSRLRHHCHPQPGIQDSVEKVLEMLHNTMSCEHGKWILDSYSWSASEQTLRRVIGGDWQTLVLDRAFIENTPDGDVCWIIDYKTARANGSMSDFCEAQLARYSAKMQAYKLALQATGVNCPINTALYYPAHKKLLLTSAA